MANKTEIGVKGIKQPTTNPTTTKKKQEFVEWDREAVIQELKEQIDLIINGRSNYKTLPQIAGKYLMTMKQFRLNCHDDDELFNLLEVYNGNYVSHIMNEAIKTGKINAQTEDFLKNEMQAYAGIGFEQHINWILDKGELVQRDTKEPFEIEVDVDKNTQQESLLWEESNERDKE